MNNKLKALITSLELSNVADKQCMQGLITVLKQMDKDHFVADNKWSTEIAFQIIAAMPDILKNPSFIKFCHTLEETDPELKNWVRESFLGEKEPERKPTPKR